MTMSRYHDIELMLVDFKAIAGNEENETLGDILASSSYNLYMHGHHARSPLTAVPFSFELFSRLSAAKQQGTRRP